MDKKQLRALRMEIAAWALMILSALATGWQSWVYSGLALLAVRAGWISQREPGERGFWSKVWDR